MSLIADLIRAGVDPELVGRVSDEIAIARAEGAASASAGPVRTARQERNKRYYERLKASETVSNKTIKTVSDAGDPSPDKEGPHTPKKITPSLTLPSVGVRSAREAAFDRFWEAYPEKVGKDAARKAFDRVGDQKRATLGDLLAGIERYRQAKPADRSWCNPATWLNQGRWQDEPAAVEQRANGARAGPGTRRNTTFQAGQELLEEIHARRGQDPFGH